MGKERQERKKLRMQESEGPLGRTELHLSSETRRKMGQMEMNLQTPQKWKP